MKIYEDKEGYLIIDGEGLLVNKSTIDITSIYKHKALFTNFTFFNGDEKKENNENK